MRTHIPILRKVSWADRFADAADRFFDWLDKPLKFVLVMALATLIADLFWRWMAAQ